MITIISTQKSWIEGTAVQQLEQVHSLNDMISVIGLPDLHAGPVGMAAASQSIIYPHLVGSDIGCGMGFWQTDGLIHKHRIDSMVKKLEDLDSIYDEEISEHDLGELRYREALGTIGAGNHFAELQKVSEIVSPNLFESLGLVKDAFALLVHSGSRGLGRSILDRHIELNGSGSGIDTCCDAGIHYLENHDYAVNWGKLNRRVIAKRFLDSLNMAGIPISDTVHNSVTCEQFCDGNRWVHRKGASPANRGAVMIAGSRGTLSYLVMPTVDTERVNFSIAHGAGRKLKRSEMEARLKKKVPLDSLTHTKFGGRVICEDKSLLYEEAPEAYKNIDQVIFDLKDAGLIEVIASYQPVITYKKREDTWK